MNEKSLVNRFKDLQRKGRSILIKMINSALASVDPQNLVFSSVFLVITYGTLKRDHWVWSTGLILSTIFLAVFGLMLTAFIINALVFFDQFSVTGLITTIITFMIDLGIVFFLTRPKTKEYFEVS